LFLLFGLTIVIKKRYIFLDNIYVSIFKPRMFA
jgi:hypothetical protein